jgi:glycosyltransferase involved in cell wall biosynthesis
MGAALKSDYSESPVPVPPPKESGGLELSVVMPCLNEAETLETCIRKAQQAIGEANIAAEVVIADNGSTDGSIEIAERLGARVVRVQAKGYGNALMGGIAAASGKYVIMGDADDSYDFGHIARFVEQLRQGSDLVMGNRFRGGIQKGAMSPLHRYLGNPVLTGVGRVLFRSSVGDFHCGLRAFRREAYQGMGLRTTGMEFASEMVVKATLFKMKISEVPTTLSPDGRSRRPHLRTWRDGWRHLRFLLLYCPRWLFLYPGIALMLLGVMLGAWLLPSSRTFAGVTFDVHTLLYAAVFVLLGFQAIAFATFTKIFAISEGLLPPDPGLDKAFGFITLEVGLVVGALFILMGLAVSAYAVGSWRSLHFGALDYAKTMRLVIPASLFLTLGVQTVFASFFLSVLGLRRR